MEKWIHLGKKLREFVNPETFPVAVKLLKDGSKIPSSAKRPLKDLKVPIGEERSFRRDLKEIISQIHFASDPDGVHVYVERMIEQEIYDESKKELKKVKVAHKKHLGSTPFTLNIDPNDPLKHGEILIFEKSGYKLATSRYAMGQKSYHQVMVPEVIKER